ncbi:MAG: hypothetical protein ACLP0B_02465 [Steroidobacteraceae bacterium]
MGKVLQITRGFAEVDTVAVYPRARIPAERTGTAESFQVFVGLSGTAIVRRELHAARDLADQMLAIARRINRPQDLVISRYHGGTSCVLLSEFAAAQQHFRQAIEYYHEEDFRGVPENHWYAFDTFAMAATTEWMLGFPEQALRYMVAARARD